MRTSTDPANRGSRDDFSYETVPLGKSGTYEMRESGPQRLSTAAVRLGRWRTPVLLSLAFLALCAAGLAGAQESPIEVAASDGAAVEEDYSRPMGPPDEFNRGTPRGSFYGFIQACNAGRFDVAAEFLDLRRLAPEELDRAPEIARRLKAVLNQQVWIDFSELSDENRGTPDDGLEPWQDRIANLATTNGPVPILLQRVPRDGDGVRIWKVAASTVSRADELFSELGPIWLESALPSPFFEWTFLRMALWQWLGIVTLALASWLASMAFAGGLVRLLGRLMTARKESPDPRVIRLVRGPVCLTIAVVLFGVWRHNLALPVPVSELLRVLGHLIHVVSAAWLAFRLLDLASLGIQVRAEQRGNVGLLPLIPPIQGIAKALIVVLGALGLLATLGVNVTALIAGLGVGGIAVALAAQKTLENLFGGLTLFVDRPVRVGEYFSSGDYSGTVEEIGLRSTRIRTLDRTILTIPNAEFSNMAIENFAPVDRRRFITKIGVRYETSSEQMRYLLARLRELLTAHPRVTDDPARVRLAGFGASSIDIEIFAYVDTGVLSDFLAVREDLYLRIMDVVSEAGTDFAFPSSTVYFGKDDGLPDDAQRAAESRVAEWRFNRQLPFPEPSDADKDEIRDSLPWPPDGSAVDSA